MLLTGHFIVGRSQRCVLGQIKYEGDIVNTSKPDLMATSPRATEGKRILAQLEHGARAPASAARVAGWNIDGWTIGLCALLLMMCSVAWLMHDKRITPETFRHNGRLAPMRSTAPPPPTTRTQAVDGPPHMEQAALIVNDAVSAPEAESPRAAVPGSVVPGSALSGSVAPKSAAPDTFIAAKLAQRAAPHKSAPNVARTTAAIPAAPGVGDTDVTLLTALVAHAAKPAEVTPDRSRDIVERQDGDTTVQLLARCKQLGLIEGMLCRSRICSGRWEGDAACRAPAH